MRVHIPLVLMEYLVMLWSQDYFITLGFTTVYNYNVLHFLPSSPNHTSIMPNSFFSRLTVWQLRRYLPSTVLSRWRKRRSVSDQFSMIVAASRARGIGLVCTGVKKCVETFQNTSTVAWSLSKAVWCVRRSGVKRTALWFACWRAEHGTCRLGRRYLQIKNGTCSMRTVLATCNRGT